MIALLQPFLGLVKGWQDSRNRKQDLKATKELKEIEGYQKMDASEFLADSKRQEGLSNSWKDEYVTLVVSFPLILCFVPGFSEDILRGFEALDKTPDWYQYMVVSIFLVGAGVPLAGKTVKTIKSIMGK